MQWDRRWWRLLISTHNFQFPFFRIDSFYRLCNIGYVNYPAPYIIICLWAAMLPPPAIIKALCLLPDPDQSKRWQTVLPVTCVAQPVWGRRRWLWIERAGEHSAPPRRWQRRTEPQSRGLPRLWQLVTSGWASVMPCPHKITEHFQRCQMVMKHFPVIALYNDRIALCTYPDINKIQDPIGRKNKTLKSKPYVSALLYKRGLFVSTCMFS